MDFERTFSNTENVRSLTTEDFAREVAAITSGAYNLLDRHPIFGQPENDSIGFRAPEIALVLDRLGGREQIGIATRIWRMDLRIVSRKAWLAFSIKRNISNLICRVSLHGPLLLVDRRALPGFARLDSEASMAAKSLSLVFTGHMVDLPGRSQARFPAALVGAAHKAIEACVERQTQGREKSDVTGYASLARGGDILFHEICREHDFATLVVLPFPPEQFLRNSVEGAEGNWPGRFEKLWNETPQSRHVLDLPQSDGAYAICNQRILNLAREGGVVQLIALWDGGGGDSPGGTADLVRRAEAVSGRKAEIINPHNLAGGSEGGHD